MREGSHAATLARVGGELHRPEVQIELGAIVLCVAVALSLALRINRRLAAHEVPAETTTARLRRGAVRRLAFPLVALALLAVARLVLGAAGIEEQLVEVASSLALAMAAINLLIYALRRTFAPTGWVRLIERYVAALIWVLFALHVFGLLDALVAALAGVSVPLGAHQVNLWQILHGSALLLLTVLLALWVGGLIETRLTRSDGLDPSVRIVMTRITKALLTLVAVLAALPAVGIDLTALSVFGGALGVGLGFGLQKVAANYVSGFIILLDRSIRIGNMITVGQDRGEVMQITTRYTVLRALGGVEALVPNEMLIGSVVLNESYTDTRVRVALPVQVSYASDLARALQVMEAAAARQARVLAQPPPKAFVVAFADSGIDLELGVWIADPQEGTLGVRSDINLEIWRAFQAQGIEIPFPQREVRLVGPSKRLS